MVKNHNKKCGSLTIWQQKSEFWQQTSPLVVRTQPNGRKPPYNHAMKVLIACECSGTVRDAFIKHGHEAVSCDLLPSDTPGPHRQCDVRELLHEHWDLMIAHPPCTYLSVSGLHLNLFNEERQVKTAAAIEFFLTLWNAPIEKIAIENPRGCIVTKTGIRYSQIIQPYSFGDDASKETWLWLKGLPTLSHTSYTAPRIVNGKNRWANQSDSGHNRESNTRNRAKNRSKTYPGIANAMATQWSPL
jgi:hypothetical protein